MAQTCTAKYDLKIGGDLAYVAGSEVSEEALKQSDAHGWGWREMVDCKRTAAHKPAEHKGTPVEEQPQAASKAYESTVSPTGEGKDK